MKFLGVAAAAAFAISATVASAATVSVLAVDAAAYGMVDVNNGTALQAGAGFVSPGPLEAAGSINSIYRSPYDAVGGPANWEDLEYFSVGPTGSEYTGTANPATLAFGSVQSVLTLLWGSVDTYNTVKLWLNGSEVASVGGAEVLAQVPAATAAGPGAALVRIAGTQFDSVSFYSSENALEFANVVAAVPLPAGGLLLFGLGGLAVLRRKRDAA